eukprot:6575174-Prymnesium_polylepis.1
MMGGPCTGKARRPIGAHRFPEATRQTVSPGSRHAHRGSSRSGRLRCVCGHCASCWEGSSPTKIDRSACRASTTS